MNVKGEINFINNINVLSNFDATITGDGIGIHNINAENISHGLINNDRLTSNIVKVDINSIDTNDLLYYNGDDWCNLKIDATTLEITTDNKLKVIGGGSSGGGNTVIINSNETTSNLLPPSLVETVSSGLIAHWKFDNDLVDEISSLTITTADSAIYPDGIFNEGLTTDGNKFVIDSSTVKDLVEGDTFTISFWMNLTTIDSSNVMYLMSRYDNNAHPTTGFRGGFMMYIRPASGSNAGKLGFDRFISTATPSVDSIVSTYSFSNNLNKWVHLSIVCFATGSKIYINGSLDNTTTHVSSWRATQTFTGTNYENQIGIAGVFKETGFTASQYDAHGDIDDLRFYDRELSAEEVEKLYLEGSDRGLIAHYKFDEVLAGNQLKDETGNYNLDYISINDIIDSTDGIFDNSMIKDNDADSIYTTADFPSITNTTTRTYSVWVKRHRINILDRIFVQGTGGAGTQIGLLFDSNNTLLLYIYSQTNTIANTSGTNILFTDTSVWIHIVAVIDNNNSKLYVNGVEVGSAINTIYTISGKMYIGEIYGYNQDARINLDDFRIYDRALSAAEVEKLYLEASDRGLIAHYKFDGDYNDSSGNNYHLTNHNASTQSTHIIDGEAVEFDNSDYLEFPSQINPYTIWNGNGITFSFWFRATSAGHWARLIDFQDTTSSSSGVLIGRYASTNNTIRIVVNDTANGDISVTNFTDSTWHHFTFSVDTSGIWTVYLDNVNKNISQTQTIPNITYNERYINKSTYSSNGNWGGQMDDFRIYDRALSAAEVEKLYYAKYIKKGSIPGSTDEYIAFKYNSATAVSGQTEYTINFPQDTECDILIVAGGGGGGAVEITNTSGTGAGGGGGGVIFLQNQTISTGTYTIKVGNGGEGDKKGDATRTTGQRGYNSSFSYLQTDAIGGGGGGTRIGGDGGDNTIGTSGGSGGGSSHNVSGSINNGGTGTVINILKADGTTIIASNYRQGYNGGVTVYESPYSSGGGGAGGNGYGSADSPDDGAGGIGRAEENEIDFKTHFNIPNDIGELHTDGKVYFAGGGSSGYRSNDTNHSTGGLGGGGSSTSEIAENGTPNTGGGGGGSRSGSAGAGDGGNGGSGIVIIRYKTSVTITTHVVDPKLSSLSSLTPESNTLLYFDGIDSINYLELDATTLEITTDNKLRVIGGGSGGGNSIIINSNETTSNLLPPSLVETVSSGLIAHYKFDDSTNVGLDSSGNNYHLTARDGTVQLSSTYAVFNSSSYYTSDSLDTTAFTFDNTAFSVSVWAYFTNTGHIITQHKSTNTNQSLAIRAEAGSNGTITYRMAFYGNAIIASNYDDTNKWIYLVFQTHSNGNREIYRNGVRIANDTNSSLLNLSGTYEVIVGAYDITNDYYDGYLDDLRIYDRALSAAEVEKLYLEGSDRGLIAHYKFDDDLTNSVSGSSIGTLTSTNTSASFIDTSGNYVFGKSALVNNTTLTIPSFHFSNLIAGTSKSFTVSFWFKANSIIETWNILFDASQYSGTDKGGIRIYIKSTDQKIYAYYYNSGSSSDVITSLNGNFTDNNWRLLTFIYTYTSHSSNVYTFDFSLYENGVLNSGSNSQVIKTDNTNGFQIGDGNPDATYPNEGYYDDFRIYDRALSAAEVEKLYLEGSDRGLIAHWKFDNDLVDEISSLTITTADTAIYPDGIFEEGLTTDGNQFVIDSSTLKDLVEGDTWTISFWINVSALDASYTMNYVTRYDSTTLNGLRGGFSVAMMNSAHGTYPASLRFMRLYASASWLNNYTTFSFNNNLNKWVHCVCVCFATGTRIYINGSLDNTETHASSWRATQRFAGTSYENQIGVGGMFKQFGFDSTNYDGHGDIDDLRFYDRELSAEEVEKLYYAQYIQQGSIPSSTDEYIAFKYNSATAVSNQTEYTIHFPQDTECDILIVGGGGGGGRAESGSTTSGGGGGGGGLIFLQNQTIPSGTYTIKVGNGASAIVNSNSRGNNGYNSSFSYLQTEAIGGGGGGTRDTGNDANIYTGDGGGSGGGSVYGTEGSPSPAGGSGTVSNIVKYDGTVLVSNYRQGYDGGDNAGNEEPYSGGGGGAGEAGKNANSGTEDGDGGDGKAGEGSIDFKTHFNISGGIGEHHTDGKVYFAGGGGGGYRTSNTSSGGLGGAGDGLSTTGSQNGMANTGGGGAGGDYDRTIDSGAGGSGIVIIRYATSVTITTQVLDPKLSSLSSLTPESNTLLYFDGIDSINYLELDATTLEITSNNQLSVIGGSGSSTGIEGIDSSSSTILEISKHLIPDTNATYDIGSAEKKIRHLYLSDTSLWIGDDNKISISDGKIKMRKRRKDIIPSKLYEVDPSINETTVLNFINSTETTENQKQSINELNLAHWEKYMRLNHQETNLQATDLFANNDDYEQDPITDALLETTNNNIVLSDNYSNIGIGYFNDTEPQYKLDVKGDININENSSFRINNKQILTISNNNLNINTEGTGDVVIMGDTSRGSGSIKFNCENNSHGVKIQGPPHTDSASYTLTLPPNAGTSNQVLSTDGNGMLSFITINESSSGGNTVIINSNETTSNLLPPSLVETVSSGLIAHYKFDGDLTDSTDPTNTSKNGTFGGTGGVASLSSTHKILGSHSLRLLSDATLYTFMTLPSFQFGNTTTISFWFNWDLSNSDDPSYQKILFFKKSTSGDRIFISRDNANNRLYFTVDCDSQTRVDYQIYNTTINDNTWYYVVWVIDNVGTWKVYINGEYEAPSNTLSSTTGQLDTSVIYDTNYIGRHESSNKDNWDGYLDDFRIYDRALSAAEVEKLYLEGSDRGLIAYWKFDTINEISGYIFKDETSNNYHLTNGGNNNPSLETGVSVFGNSANFINSTDQYVETTGINLGRKSFTISVWLKLTGQGFFISQGATMGDGNQLHIGIRSNKWCFHNWGYAVESAANYASDVNGDWVHLCFVNDRIGSGNNTKYIYRNNVLIASSASQVDFDNDDSDPLRIGAYSNSTTEVYQGYLDDLRIYDRVLSAAEVEKLYYDQYIQKGDISSSTDEYIAFKYNSSTAVSNQTEYSINFPQDTECDILIVGGGGGGGTLETTNTSAVGAGGGGGGVIFLENQTVSAGTYTIKVGNGGEGDLYANATRTTGERGYNSSFSYLQTEAIGGGGGGTRFDGDGSLNTVGTSGGSGGGSTMPTSGLTNSGGTGTVGNILKADGTTILASSYRQGYDGGSANWDSPYAGGGGGAGGNGYGTLDTPDDGAGGIGRAAENGIDFKTHFNIPFGIGEHHTDGKVYFAGGGGAGYRSNDTNHNVGGLGGGGSSSSEASENGTPHTGGGGGGARNGDSGALQKGGAGGSGIVIIRYATSVTITTQVVDPKLSSLSSLRPESNTLLYFDGIDSINYLELDPTTLEITTDNKLKVIGGGSGGGNTDLINSNETTSNLLPPSLVDMSVERMFPPTRNFTSASHTISGQSYGNGVYDTWESTKYNSSLGGYTAFNTSTANGYHGTNNYNSSTGVFNGTFNNDGGNLTTLAYTGDWIKIKMPIYINLTKYGLKQRLHNTNVQDILNRAPKDYRIYGSNDNINWTILEDKSSANAITSSDYNSSYLYEASISTTGEYQYFIIIVNKLLGNQGYLNLDEWYIYGKENFTTADGLIAHYKFDDSTNIGLDSTGSHNLTATGTLQIDTTNYVFGKSSYMSGDDYFQTPASLNPYNIWNSNGITISGWFKLDPTSPDWAAVWEIHDNSSSVRILKNGSNKTLYYGKLHSGTYTDQTTTTEVFNNTWFNLAMTIDTSGNATLYINNVAETVLSGITLINTFATLNISQSSSYTTRKFKGYLDDFRIYDRVLSAEEVEKLYNSQYIQKGSISGSTDEYIAFKYNPDTAVSGQTEYNINFPQNTECDILIVGGGGGGSQAHGGGGGGGAVIFMKDVVMNGNYTIKVGDGGDVEGTTGTGTNGKGLKGNNSEIFKTNTNKVTAEGGGGGGQETNGDGGDGGSGGGGDAYDHTSTAQKGSATGYTPILDGITGIKYGYDGANASGDPGGGGGGGGAGGAGSAASGTQTNGNNGGIGLATVSISETNYDLKTHFGITGDIGEHHTDGKVYFAGGGGGGVWLAASGGIGGIGGGGNGGAGGTAPGNEGETAQSNTGGGGGGGGDHTPIGGKGGSGIVIIRYATSVTITTQVVDPKLSSLSSLTPESNTLLYFDGIDSINYLELDATTLEITADNKLKVIGGGSGGGNTVLINSNETTSNLLPPSLVETVSSGLIAHYKFDDSTNIGLDSSVGGIGNATPSSSSVTATTAQKIIGVSGAVIAQERLDLPNITFGSSNTISFWIKLDMTPVTDTSYNYIFSFQSSSSRGIYLNRNGTSTTEWNLWFFSGSGAYNQHIVSNVLEDNVWYHILISWNATNVNMYFNNVLELNNQSSSHFRYSSAYTTNTIGRTTQDQINGYIDDFRIYDRALSAAEVEKLYLEGSDRGLIAHWKFDGDLTDSSGVGNSLSISSTGSGATAMSYVDGLFNNAISFNNTGTYTSEREYLRIGNTVTQNIKTLRETNGITFSVWFYPTFPSANSTEDYHCIFDTDGDGTFYFRQYQQTYNIELAINGNQYFTTNTFQSNKWNNIVIVLYTGSTFNIDLILNGVTTTHSSIADTVFGTTSDYNINNGYIGIRHNVSSIKTAETWDGDFEDFRIYDRALSVAEVEKLYLEGSDRGLIAHYKFDDDLTDSSGNNNHLEAVVGGHTYPDGVYDEAVLFASSNTTELRTINNFQQITHNTSFSVSTWVKRTNTNKHIIFAWGDAYSNNASIGLTVESSGRIQNYIWGATALETTNTFTDTTKYYFIVLTRTAGSQKIYVDGVLEDSFTNTDTLDTGTTKLHIGYASPSWANSANYLDDFRIYNRALSAAEVEKLYYEQYIQKGSISNSTDEYIEFKYNPATAVSGQTEYTINFPEDTECDILIVGGGGGGGKSGENGAGGGGGAGGLIYLQNQKVSAGNYTIKVGNGAAEQTTVDDAGYNGYNSSFSYHSTEAQGGGGGGGHTNQDTRNSGSGFNGGSGGGLGAHSYGGTSGKSAGSGTAGQGNDGGSGSSSNANAGGGGGSSSVGVNATTSAGGNGGNGSLISITGTNVYYAGGGGGGGEQSNNGGDGGQGGGGKGGGDGGDTDTNGENATHHTGSGGGGAGGSGNGGAGGSGIVIIRYATSVTITTQVVDPKLSSLSSLTPESNTLLYFDGIDSINYLELDATTLEITADNKLKVIGGGSGGGNTVIINSNETTSNLLPPSLVDMSVERMYPPTRTLTANTDTITGQTYANGTYVVSQSTTYDSTRIGYSAFSGGSHTTGPVFAANEYSSGTYTGTNYIVSGYNGDWLKIKLPVYINLTKYGFTQRTDASYPNRAPGNFKIYGSNDDTNWTVLVSNSITGAADYSNGLYEASVSTIGEYQYLALVVNQLSGSDNILNFDEWYIYGKENFTTADGLIAHWKFDNDLVDEISSLAITTADTEIYPDGIFETGLTTDGNNYVIDNSTLKDLVEGDIWTISFWINVSALDASYVMYYISRYDSGTLNGLRGGFSIAITNSTNGTAPGKLRFERLYDQSSWSVNYTNFSFNNNLNKWVNCVVVCFATGSRIYINGSLDNTETHASSWRATQRFTGTSYENQIGVGGMFKNTGFQTSVYDGYGDIDDLRFYDRELSAAEIEKLYLEGSDRGLIAHYKFDGDLADTIDPSNNQLALYSGDDDWVSGGIFGEALDFDGDRYIITSSQLVSALDTHSSWSVSVWVKVDSSLGTNYLPIITRYDASTTSGNRGGFVCSIYQAKFRLERWYIAANYINLYSTTLISDHWDEWILVSFVSSNRKLEIYVNGSLDASDTSATNDWQVTQTFSGTSYANQIGLGGFFRNVSNANPFNSTQTGEGYLDDFRIYDRALSAAEVEKLYYDQYIQKGSISNSTDEYIAFKYNPNNGVIVWNMEWTHDETIPWGLQEAVNWSDDVIVYANGTTYTSRIPTQTELVDWLNNSGQTYFPLSGVSEWAFVKRDDNDNYRIVQIGIANSSYSFATHHIGSQYIDMDLSTVGTTGDSSTWAGHHFRIVPKIVQTEYTINFPEDTECDILIVGGGGGGGTVETTGTSAVGAGGGGGGVIFLENQTVSSGTYTIKVGNGGEGDLYSDSTRTTGEKGYNSSFSYLQTEAIGGGGGGTRFATEAANTLGLNGGSGGGSVYDSAGNAGGSGTVSNILKADGTTILASSYRQGYDGGLASSDSPFGSGGGGAGGNGYGTTDTPDDSAGGIGRATENGIDFKTHFNIPNGIGEHHTDGKVYFAGGGGAGYRSDDTNHNAGGLGGGGGSSSGKSENGTPHTGGGGGGARNGTAGALQKGGAGGSGIVIIRYATSVTITTQVVDPKLSSLSSLTPESNTLLYFDGIDSINYLELDATTLEITSNNQLSVIGGSGSSIGIEGIDSSSSTILEISKHLIPDTNATYDIGSAEKKIRHLYLSDTSLWIGDDNKISISDGKIKMRKRRKDIIPSKLLEVDPSINETTVLNFINSTETTQNQKQNINELNLAHWEKYMRLNHQETNLQASDLFANNNDYEQDPIIDAFIQRINSNIVLNNNYNNIGIGVFDDAETTVEPSELLHIRKAGNPRIRISGTTDHNTAGVRFEETTGNGGEIIYDGYPNLVQINTIHNGTVNNAISISRNNRLVGIGTTSPNHPLHVVTGSGTYSAPLYAYHHAGGSWQNYNGTTWGTTVNLISIRANEGVIAQRMYIMSDERIKETITDIQDNEALVKFRQLQPKKYKYKDKLKYGDNEVYGFIAQEVSSILPNAVTLEKDYIPDVMLTAEVILYDDCSKLKTLENHNLNVNDIIRCKTAYYKDIDNIKILEVIDEKTIKVDYIFNTDELKFNDMDNIIIIYGKYVEDFNVLNKETIWTLTTSALQQVDREMQQEKQKVITLENKVLTLENTITNLVSRIETLEQTNT